MLDIHCGSCGRLLEGDASMLVEVFACPYCGAPVRLPVSPDIIDVQARVIGESAEAQGQPTGQDITQPSVQRSEPPPQMRGFTWIYERQAQGGPGCCSCGCLIALAVAALALQGLFSLF